MRIRLEFWPTLAFAGVIACWMWFGLILVLSKGARPAGKNQETKRERAYKWGVVLQGLGYSTVWILRRRPFTPQFSIPPSIEIILSLATIALAVASTGLVFAAIRTLGKQWAVAARLVEGHRLVQEGPYRIVRNPIYAGMFGMMLATGLAISHWIAFFLAVPLFIIGTMIRVRSEEKLLRGAFGPEFENYVRRVPVLVPFVF